MSLAQITWKCQIETSFWTFSIIPNKEQLETHLGKVIKFQTYFHQNRPFFHSRQGLVIFVYFSTWCHIIIQTIYWFTQVSLCGYFYLYNNVFNEPDFWSFFYIHISVYTEIFAYFDDDWTHKILNIILYTFKLWLIFCQIYNFGTSKLVKLLFSILKKN